MIQKCDLVWTIRVSKYENYFENQWNFLMYFTFQVYIPYKCQNLKATHYESLCDLNIME